jgi:hypothetical protein
MTLNLLRFMNELSATLSFLCFFILLARLIQLALYARPDGTNIIYSPDANVDAKRMRKEKLILVIGVSVFVLGTFLLDARNIYARATQFWEGTYWWSAVGYAAKCLGSLILARQFSLLRCGERGWLTLLAIGVVVAGVLI